MDNSQESADGVMQLHIVALANQSDISEIKTNLQSVLVDTNLNPEQKIECISRAIRFTMEHKPISSLPSTHTSADNHEDTTLVDTTRYTI